MMIVSIGHAFETTRGTITIEPRFLIKDSGGSQCTGFGVNIPFVPLPKPVGISPEERQRRLKAYMGKAGIDLRKRYRLRAIKTPAS